uniref:Reverse transcriptase Ty1/copia-type domain-containing protein n=1 Tax=Tanacetum cinerariifolium TaxID=118510 RepID=A0A6L2LXH9_TANCI|nr:hypothetical protein [Tanacetum cinerariifolium]
MASEQSSLELALHEMTPATLSSGLVPTLPPLAPFVPPSRHEWDLVFQPVFNEFFSPPASIASLVLVEEATAPVKSTETVSVESSSKDVIHAHVHSDTLNSEHSRKLTKDHPLLEPKTYKEALTQSCWIEAMQEELHEFKHLEEEGINFEESFAPVPKLEAVRTFLVFAAHMNMIVYQMDVKTAPRVWYDLLSLFLLSQGFFKGTVDLTLFNSRKGKDILLSPKGIFLNQSKYALKSLKEYRMESHDLVDTPMVEKSKLDEDTQGKAIDPTHYRGMVGTLMYLTSSRPDLVYAVCMCAWYQDFAIALTAFADADHAGCQDTRRSTSRSMQLLGDKLVS